jgi:hypothetical protein
VADELLGMPERDQHMDSQIFPPKNDTNIGFGRLYLKSFVELRSWGFFGVSID